MSPRARNGLHTFNMFTTFSASATPSTQARACDSCRRLKIKCRNPPSVSECLPCIECRRARLKCTYRDVPAKRGRPRKEHHGGSKQSTFETLVDLNSPESVGEPRQLVPASETLNEPDQTPLRRLHGSLEYQTDIAAISATANDSTFMSGDFQTLPDYDHFDSTEFSINQKQNTFIQMPEHDLDVWDYVNEFFDTIYILYPIISYTDIASRLIMEPNWAICPDLRTMVYTIRLSIAVSKHFMHLKSEKEVNSLIQQVEASRLSYSFADPPTLDAVACSLCLSAAHSVLKNHNRAFVYLNEASLLLEGCSPATYTEIERKRRTEEVLFNADWAFFQFLSAEGFRRITRRQNDFKDQSRGQEPLGRDVEADQFAACQLHRLARIHAEDLRDLGDIEDITESLVKASYRPKNPLQRQYVQIQVANVAVTHNWLLSCKMVANCDGSSATRSLERANIESLGVAAMSWVCSLTEGDLRIVGLGKLTGLALNIWTISSCRASQEVLHGLTSAVVKEDHEGEYLVALADLIEPFVYKLPLPVSPSCERKLEASSTLRSLQQDTIVVNAHGDSPELGSKDQSYWACQLDLDYVGNWEESWIDYSTWECQQHGE